MFLKALGAVRRFVAGILGWRDVVPKVPVPTLPVRPLGTDLDVAVVPVERDSVLVTPEEVGEHVVANTDASAAEPHRVGGDEALLIIGSSAQRAVFHLRQVGGGSHGRPVELVLTEAGRKYLAENGLL